MAAMRTTRSHCDGRRPGSAYVLFLFVVMLVSTIGVSALLAWRIQIRCAAAAANCAAARFHARSAIELGFAMIRQNPSWRTSPGSGTWISNQPIGQHGTMTLRVTILDDGDGNPTNDSAMLAATGVEGDARHEMTVTVERKDAGMRVVPDSFTQQVN
jgi:type II secretory pathway component PulK